ncbi:UNVERIFIED_CONTAM: hypothetical protein GTU68_055476 [Idotea baltica]|nr:hypothetical protein [Idotea baltica]
MMNDNPTPIGQIAQNIRTARLAKGVTQADLARQLGISFQQVQKYETGFNRVSADRLVRIAHMLDTEIGFFFRGTDMGQAALDIDARYLKTCAHLGQIENEEVRTSVIDLIRLLSQHTDKRAI